MRLNLYIGNHGDCRGVEEFISILSAIVARNALSLTVKQSFCPASINVVVDEFTNVLAVEELRSFRSQHPHAPVVFWLTEFFHQAYGVESFNNFGGWSEQCLLAAFEIECKRRRPDLGRISIAHFFRALVALPSVATSVMRGKISDLLSFNKATLPFVKKIARNAYLHMRYLGLKENIHLADGILVAHPAIASQVAKRYPQIPLLGCLYPEFGTFRFKDEAFWALDNSMEVTGSITAFRRATMERINFELRMLGIRSNIKGCYDRGFDSKEPRAPAAFSLHVPQSPKWPYSSPTRIFRAIVKDQTVPIMSRYFGQHPIEECAIVLDGINTFRMMSDFYRRKRSAASVLNQRIAAYEQVAVSANQECVNALGAFSMNDGVSESNTRALTMI